MEMTTPEREARAGDDPRTRVDEAWRVFGPTAMRFATALVGPSDAHDVATNAFLRVTRQQHWAELDYFDRYLLRAVRNEAQNLYRDRRRRWERDLRAVAGNPKPDVVADVDVVHAIAALSLEQRSAVYLAYWVEMTEAQIAETLGVTRSTVHRNLGRARAQLRKALR
jgi:RNA polymerase sigma factor (sigma-70 family)